MNRQHENKNIDCIWDCLECDCYTCEYYYFEDMEYDETNRKEEFLIDWFEYIEDREE